MGLGQRLQEGCGLFLFHISVFSHPCNTWLTTFGTSLPFIKPDQVLLSCSCSQAEPLSELQLCICFGGYILSCSADVKILYMRRLDSGLVYNLSSKRMLGQKEFDACV